MIRFPGPTPLVAILALLAAACMAEPPVGSSSRAAILYNAMSFNALAFNALAFNALTYNALTFNGRYLNGLDSVGLDPADPSVHQFLEYTISCALPAGSQVIARTDEADYAFDGAIGLAPEWADGPCELDCQRWVSACLLARVNARGERVEISIRADHPALHPAPRELTEFAREEGTYYGNLFDDVQDAFATSARDDLELPRTCGNSIDDCYVDVVGTSADACAGWAQALGRRDCQDIDGATWPHAVTVYLR